MPRMGSYSKPVLKRMTDTMPFGEFKGHTVEYILNRKPSYIIWLDDEKVVDVDPNILMEAENRDMEEYDLSNWNYWGISMGDED
jgi:hypothetical protein